MQALKRVAPLSGLAGIVLALVGFVIAGDMPRPDASAASVASFYLKNSSSGITAAYVLAWSAPFFVLFGAALATRLRPTGVDRTGLAPWVIAAGGVITAVGFLAASAFHFAVSEGGKYKYSPDTLRALAALDQDALVIFSGGLGILLLGAGAAMIGRAGMMRVLGWAALVIGVAIFMPAGVGLIGTGLGALWVIVAGVVLTLGARNPNSEVAPAP